MHFLYCLLHNSYFQQMQSEYWREIIRRYVSIGFQETVGLASVDGDRIHSLQETKKNMKQESAVRYLDRRGSMIGRLEVWYQVTLLGTRLTMSNQTNPEMTVAAGRVQLCKAEQRSQEVWEGETSNFELARNNNDDVFVSSSLQQSAQYGCRLSLSHTLSPQGMSRECAWNEETVPVLRSLLCNSITNEAHNLFQNGQVLEILCKCVSRGIQEAARLTNADLSRTNGLLQIE